MLAADRLDEVPVRLPKVGDWLGISPLPQVLLRDRAHVLSAETAGHIVIMLTISAPGEPYPGLEVVREARDRAPHGPASARRAGQRGEGPGRA
jgi:hypothetical protein